MKNYAVSPARERITSRSNPLIARVKKLKSRRAARRQEGVFLCEGPKMLAEALKWGAEIETVICLEDAVLPALPEGVRVVEVPEELLLQAADTETPQGVVFLCRIPERDAGELESWEHIIVLDGLQDPGNVGTIWRTADAFGADGLVLCNHCADAWSPKTVRATMGAAFRLPVVECDLEKLGELARCKGIPVYTTALREDTADLREADLSRAAVIIGSEGRGVSEEALALCERTLKIPMRERCESLNAAAAATVVLWEMAKRRL